MKKAQGFNFHGLWFLLVFGDFFVSLPSSAFWFLWTSPRPLFFFAISLPLWSIISHQGLVQVASHWFRFHSRPRLLFYDRNDPSRRYPVSLSPSIFHCWIFGLVSSRASRDTTFFLFVVAYFYLSCSASLNSATVVLIDPISIVFFNDGH